MGVRNTTAQEGTAMTDTAANVIPESGKVTRHHRNTQVILDAAATARAEGTGPLDADALFSDDQQMTRSERVAEYGGTNGIARTRDGRVAYAGRLPAWYDAGTVFGEAVTPERALTEIGAWFDVKKVKVQTSTKQRFTIPDKFAIVNSETGEPLSVVGREYVPFSHKDVADFLERVFGLLGAWVESAAMIGQNQRFEHATGAEKVLLSARMPEAIVLDEGGRADYLNWYVNAANSLNGRSRLFVANSPVRGVCGNSDGITKVLASSNLVMHWSCMHKALLPSKVANAEEAFGILTAARDAYRDQCEAMIRTKATEDDMAEIVRSIWEEPKGTTGQAAAARTAWKENTDRIIHRGLTDPTQETIAGTVWGAFNAVTLELRDAEVRPQGRMSEQVRRAILTADVLGDGKALLTKNEKAWRLAQRKTLTNTRA
jgi:phage/plasmid-like protein (TIGR03299 family)